MPVIDLTSDELEFLRIALTQVRPVFEEKTVPADGRTEYYIEANKDYVVRTRKLWRRLYECEHNLMPPVAPCRKDPSLPVAVIIGLVLPVLIVWVVLSVRVWP